MKPFSCLARNFCSKYRIEASGADSEENQNCLLIKLEKNTPQNAVFQTTAQQNFVRENLKDFKNGEAVRIEVYLSADSDY